MDHMFREELRHQQGFLTTTGADQRLLGPNDKRRRFIVNGPIQSFPNTTNQNQSTHNVSTATTGVKLSFTAPAGTACVINAASFFETAGTGVVAALQMITGGSTITIIQPTTSGTFVGPINMAVGDVIQWNVITAIAASTSDFGLFIIQPTTPNLNNRITLAFGQPAILDSGLTVHQQTSPFSIVDGDMMRAIREEIRVIGSQPGFLIGFEEFYAQ